MDMPARDYTNGSYRYSFNGKEHDDEINGGRNSIDYGFRVYDPRIAKFLSVDPLTEEYPELTPYQFGSNRPIDGIDFDGKEWMKFDLIKSDGKTQLKAVSVNVGFTNVVGAFVERDPFYTVNYNGQEYSFNNVDDLKAFVLSDQSGYATDGQKTAEVFVNTANALVYMHGEAQIDAGNAALSKDGLVSTNYLPPPNTAKQQSSQKVDAKKTNYSGIDPKKGSTEGANFTQAQKKAILEKNKAANNGVLKDDVTGQTLNQPKKDVKGVKTDMNSAQVDHIAPKSKGGTNAGSNAQVISKESNTKKGNKTK